MRRRGARSAAPWALGLSLAFVFLLPVVVRPDALVIPRAMTATTIAEIFVEDDHVRLELEIGIPDLAAFPALLPDTLYERLGHEPAPLAERGSPPPHSRLPASGARVRRPGQEHEAQAPLSRPDPRK